MASRRCPTSRISTSQLRDLWLLGGDHRLVCPERCRIASQRSWVTSSSRPRRSHWRSVEEGERDLRCRGLLRGKLGPSLALYTAASDRKAGHYDGILPPG